MPETKSGWSLLVEDLEAKNREVEDGSNAQIGDEDK